MYRTAEEERAWGARLSDREVVNAKNGTSYGPETPLIHRVQSWERHTADFAVEWLIQAVTDFTEDEDPETKRIWLAALQRGVAWLIAQEALIRNSGA